MNERTKLEKATVKLYLAYKKAEAFGDFVPTASAVFAKALVGQGG